MIARNILLTLALAGVSFFAKAQTGSLDSLFDAGAPAIAGQGGGVTMIIMKDDKQVFSKSYGSFSPDKQVLIASASKWYSAAVIMAMVDEGKLSLDDRVSKYIPSFTGDKAGITIRQCYSHTSGLPAGKHSVDEIMSDGKQTYAEMADEIAKTKMIAKPGAQLNYGGLSMQVAGRVAEVVSGKSFNDLFKEKITGPLDMDNTFFAGMRIGRVPRLAGGAFSCAGDYLKFLQMLLHKGMYNGKRVLSEKAVNAMLADQTLDAEIGYSPFNQYKKLYPGQPDARYGIGNWIIQGKGEEQVNTSPGLFGFTPWVDRKNNIIGVIAVRSQNTKVMPFFRKVQVELRKQLNN
ncbi:MAG: serine hydrolase domain-containing protein [Mucilaginibacter sp.]